MRLLVEGHKYPAAVVKETLHGIDALEDIEGFVCLNYVGYFYNTEIKDCVFLLPKVLLEDKNGQELVFGKYTPEDMVCPDTCPEISKKERDFIYELAVWIYRTINVFKTNRKESSGIIYQKRIIESGNGKRRLANTFLDILLALLRFNQENKNFFFFILKNLHSGHNKINWTRTIARTDAIIQDNVPIYTSVVNKKRQINFDEELLVIFFSILNYISGHYGFKKDMVCNLELINGKRFELYLESLGKKRLLAIRYKYFSDKALELWDLCFAFFDMAKQIRVNANKQEYLLAKDFNIVFEAIIDELIADKDIPKGLKEQEDGKIVDHLYTWQSLTSSNENQTTYYIGDSKYYKRGNKVGSNSIYKQFTYARNVIQWNLDLFSDKEKLSNENCKDFKNVGKLRDDVTEGYNIIPNFFISSALNDKLDYEPNLKSSDKKHSDFCNKHFENRLFDRDTLLVSHYDVNFLYVVSLYARNNTLEKNAWKSHVRKIFCDKIRGVLQEKYDFYAMKALPGKNAESYIKDHFQDVLGKIYTPFSDHEIFSLALDKSIAFREENNALLGQLSENFEIIQCRLGEKPEFKSINLQKAISDKAKQLLSDEKNVLTGYIRKDETYYEDFKASRATTYIMEKIPTNFAGIKYFLAMPGGSANGIYKVSKMSFVMIDGQPRLQLGLSEFAEFCETPKSIYGKMRPGETISTNNCRALFAD